MVPLFNETLTAIVSQEGLGGAWTSDRAIELLLVSGLLPEAAWFAYRVGDWKAAFMMAVACKHQQAATKNVTHR